MTTNNTSNKQTPPTRNDVCDALLSKGFTPLPQAEGYSTLLVMANAGDESVVAVPFRDAAEAVKLFASGLSWHLQTHPTRPLRYVIIRGTPTAQQSTAHALAALVVEGVNVRIEVDFVPRPRNPLGDLASQAWVDAMLSRRPTPQFGSALRAQGFRWYRSVTGSTWSGRVNGLQVCTMDEQGQLEFGVGKDGQVGRVSDAQAWFRTHCPKATSYRQKERDEATQLLTKLVNDPPPPTVKPEHQLEARVLDRRCVLTTDAGQLEPIGGPDDAPFQFPARWWPAGNPRYIDAMMRSGKTTPWVVELKVDQGQGQYLRDGLVQVALYRDYVLNAPTLDPWFKQASLERTACRALAVFPELRGSGAERLKNDHEAVARALGVTVAWLPI